MSRLAALASLSAVWLGLAAATPLPLTPSPPDLTGLVPFVSAPLDKPPLKVPSLALPAPPLEAPTVSPAVLVLPSGDRPMAPMPPARSFPCVGTWTGSASEALECGRARFQRGDLDDARSSLDQAIRGGGDRELTAEARYWLGETVYRLGRVEQADSFFRQVSQERSPGFSAFARHASGWTALMLGDPARARDAFATILGVSHPLAIDAWARHGLGLSQYALGRYAEAQRTFADLLGRRPPQALERDAIFWNGDALGRIGDPAKAVTELTRFTQGGAHPLLAPAYVRLAWWNLVTRRTAESLAALRAYPAARQPETKPESMKPSLARSVAAQDAADRDWIDATQALALLASGDWDGARTAAQPLATRRSPLALPVQLRLAAEGVARRATSVVDGWIADLLKTSLTQPVRAWLLAVRGDVALAEGKADDARTQYDLARGIDAASETGRYTSFRLAQTNLEMREFTQALADLAPLIAAPGEGATRLTVLLLQGEAAYRSGDYKTAATAFERVLAEAPEHSEASSVRLALAWTAMREGRTEDAGRRFAEFAQRYPDDEQTSSALVLASEMALASGNFPEARELLDRVLARYPRAPRSEFARLNRAILMLRTGEGVSAVTILRDWTSRAPFAPLLGRAQVALGIAQLTAGRPDEAKQSFAAARREGEGALASLGSANVALLEGKLPEAARDFGEARRDGTAAVAAASDYGMASVALQRGDVATFKTSAQAVLDATPRGPVVPQFLYALAGVSAESKDWAPALAMAKRLVAEYPDDERADDALERVGAAAGKARVWPVTYEAYALLREKYPRSPFIDDSRLAFGEAQVETGRAAAGAKTLEQYLGSAPPGPRTAGARFMLARARETTGDRAGAVEAYRKLAETNPPSQWEKDRFFGYVRLLTRERHYGEVRGLLEPYIKSASTPLAAEGALALGETLQAQGDGAAAIEYFMTAAYAAPDSLAGQRGLVAAGRTYASLKQTDAAATLYRKLLAQSNVPTELATAARQGLAELGR